MKVLPSCVSIVSGVCTLSSTLTGADEYSISERSLRGRFDGIHQALRVVGEGELGQLVGDLEVAQRRLRGQLVAEADAVVERADDEG